MAKKRVRPQAHKLHAKRQKQSGPKRPNTSGFQMTANLRLTPAHLAGLIAIAAALGIVAWVAFRAGYTEALFEWLLKFVAMVLAAVQQDK